MLYTLRLILIPKAIDEGSGGSSAWRPITISSVIIRLMHKILSKRLENIQLHHNQRGFCRLDGCFANVSTVNSIVKLHRRRGKPLAIVSLDVAKAFDTVSHHSVTRALRRLNIDQRTIQYVEQNFENATTSFGETAREVLVKRGVKQGDPLSPMLFNIVLDELMVSLDTFSGVCVGSEQIRALAFADDVLLFADNAQEVERMVETVRRFLAARGMQLNPAKSKLVHLETVPGKKKVFVSHTPIKCGDAFIPAVRLDEAMRYLGAEFTPFGENTCAVPLLFTHLRRLKRAPLKPSQRLRILRDFLLPRYIAVLQQPSISKKTLKEADRKIRVFAREVLHLNPHCHSSVLHAPTKEGGLGIMCLAERIPGIISARIRRLREADTKYDAIMQQDQLWVDRMQRMVQPVSEKRTN